MQKHSNEQKSSGVQSLIDRLQAEGVASGREQGERIISDAEKRAEWLLQQAKEEAAQIVDAAKKEAGFIENAGREALGMAVRDSQLFLKNHLAGAFAAQIDKLVQEAMTQTDLLERMVLEIANQSRPVDQDVKVLLGDASSDSALNEEAANALIQFVSEQAKAMLDQGVDVAVDKNPSASIRIQLNEQQAEVILTEASISALIMQQIQPRFKALLEGLMS